MMNVYSVFDNISEKFGNPFVALSDKVALRDFNVGMSSMNSLIKKDYALLCVGTFDEKTGVVSPALHRILDGSILPIPEDMSDLQNKDESQVANLKEMLNNE